MRMFRVVIPYYHITGLPMQEMWPWGQRPSCRCARSVSCSSQEGASLSKEEGTGRTLSISQVPSAWPLPPEPIALLTKLCSFVRKRAKTLVFVQSYPSRETPAGPSERHGRTEAKTPSPFHDTATHDDLRGGSGCLLLFLQNLFSPLCCTCSAVRMCVRVYMCTRM